MSAHILPAAGVAQHEATTACPCRPAVEQGRRGDGTYGRIVIHHGAGEPASQEIEE